MSTPKIIILEGPDGAGKTTLANKLQLLLPPPATVIHEGVLPDFVSSPFDYYRWKLLQAIGKEGVVILDRFHVGQYVYAPMWREDYRFGRRHLLEFSEFLKKQAIPTYLVLPPFEEALKNYKVKLAAKNDYLGDINAWYESYYRFKSLGCWFPEFDYTQHTPEQLLAGDLL